MKKSRNTNNLNSENKLFSAKNQKNKHHLKALDQHSIKSLSYVSYYVNMRIQTMLQERHGTRKL